MKFLTLLEALRDLSARALGRAFDLLRRGAIRVRALAAGAWRSDLRRRLTGPALSLTRIAVVAFVLHLGLVSLLKAAVVTVPPTDIAVVQRNWGTGAGVVPGDVGMGRLRILPGRDVVHRLSARTHFLRFGMESEGNDFESLELRSTDGLEIRVGVTLPYRIAAGQAHQIVAEGRRSTYSLAARAAAERVLLRELAKLDRAGWADVSTRRSAEAAALEAIAEAFEPFHLVPLGVHVTAAWFPPLYEVELQEQKLLEQRILTDEMLSRLDERQHELLVERESQSRAETELAADFDFRIEVARLELQKTIRDVERAAQQHRFERGTAAENEYAKAVAEGKLALERAEALRESLVNEALETDGGRLLLARDAASNLRFKSITLDANHPNVPTVLDLDAMSRLLIGE